MISADQRRKITDLVLAHIRGPGKIEVAAAMVRELHALFQTSLTDLPADAEEIIAGWHAVMKDVPPGPYDLDELSTDRTAKVLFHHPRDGVQAIATVPNFGDPMVAPGIAAGTAEWFRSCSPVAIMQLLDLLAIQAAQLHTMRKLMSPGWRPILSAPEDEPVLLATSEGWVGEATMLREQGTGRQTWAWAGGEPLHDNHEPLGWMSLPEGLSNAVVAPPSRVGDIAAQIEAIHALRERAMDQRDAARREADKNALELVVARARIAALEAQVAETAS